MAQRFTKKSTSKNPTNRQVVPAHPLWALVLFTLALLALAAIVDFNTSQSTYKTTNADPGDNLVGVFGANFSFVSFLYIGVATWLLPIYLMWFGVRLLLQQAPKKRTATVLMSALSIVCASGLLAMIELLGFASAESSIFKDQLYDRGFGGLIGYVLTEPFLQSYIG
ncbi:MAG: DNA translocase FtsK 4TM domain-containing protein, partial [Verrucomicrobiota bacterium]|nr:DNA translocase FtsK 4TM domain-containing protein [Verrucomicrobiota bacterium]